jgi:hypothetical protein
MSMMRLPRRTKRTKEPDAVVIWVGEMSRDETSLEDVDILALNQALNWA